LARQKSDDEGQRDFHGCDGIVHQQNTRTREATSSARFGS
jgi:adenylate kinase